VAPHRTSNPKVGGSNPSGRATHQFRKGIRKVRKSPHHRIPPLPKFRDFAALLPVSLLISYIPLSAQFSYSPKPAPEFRWFAISEFGAVLTLNRVETSSREQLLNWELGLMGNLNSKQSLGGTLFASYSKDAEIYAGPKLRYRFWLNPGLALDAGVGPIWRLNYIESGTWVSAQFGVSYLDWGQFFFQFDFFEDTIASAGLKIGRLPGAILGSVAAGIAGVRFLVSRLD